MADMQRVPQDGRLRVHRTRDAGETWTELGEGLPDDAWVAVMRDAFCADAADPTGIYVGTRDGCVYASNDEGDSFTLVADHLPDVLTVKAADAAVSVQVLLPGVLAALAGGEKHVDVEPAGDTLADLLDALAAEHPMLARRIRDETGQVRRFVNVYVDGDDVRFEGGLATKVRDGAEVQVLPSVAGG